MNMVRVIGQLVSAVAFMLQAATPPVTLAGCTPPAGVFGTAVKSDVSMEGKIYYLPSGTGRLPDFSTLESHGSIFTDQWNVPARDFTAGFPGVSDRFEWFALDFRGSIYVASAGTYTFELTSDDGSKLWIDDAVVADNDGIHGMWSNSGNVTLTSGDHAFRLSYFQGPATSVGLQLYVTPPGGARRIFRLQDFDERLAESRRLLGVTETQTDILVRFGAAVLFDTAKDDLKPQAQDSLTELATLLRDYPGHPITIEGYTDAVGNAASNQRLSERRAASVRDWLVSHGGAPAACVTTKGFGAAHPVAPNTTAAGREKNRRVEVRLQKDASR